MTPDELERAMAEQVESPSPGRTQPNSAAGLTGLAPHVANLSNQIGMVTPPPVSPVHPARSLPGCKICKLSVEPHEGIKARSSDAWVHRTCLDMRRERLRESLRCDARIKVETLLASLPKSRDEDDAAMLVHAPEKLRRFHGGWTRKSGLSALIVGLSGSCKTLSLAAKFRDEIGVATEEFIEHDGKSSDLNWIARAYFTTAFKLCEATRQHPLGQGECPEVLKARTASLLLLDDLGNENPGFEKWLLSIIDSRIAEQLPTWVTSGFMVEALSERYGQALVRRLCEKGAGTLIDLFRAGAALKAVR